MPFIISGGGKVPPAVYGHGALASSASIDIGPARNDRIIVVAGQREDDTTRQTPAPTITGLTLLNVYNPTEADNEGMWYAVADASKGTSLSFSGGQTRNAYWVLTGVTAIRTGLVGSVSGTNVALTDTPPDAAIMVGIARSRSAMGAASPSWSGADVGQLTTSSTSGGGSSGWMAAYGLRVSGGALTMNLNQAAAYSTGSGGGGVFV